MKQVIAFALMFVNVAYCMDTASYKKINGMVWEAENDILIKIHKQFLPTSKRLNYSFKDYEIVVAEEKSWCGRSTSKILINKSNILCEYSFLNLRSFARDILVTPEGTINLLFDFTKKGPDNYPKEHCFLAALKLSIDELCKKSSYEFRDADYSRIFYKGKGQRLHYDLETAKVTVFDQDWQKLSIENENQKLKEHYTFWVSDGD